MLPSRNSRCGYSAPYQVFFFTPVSEALSLQVEDVDLTRDDEHLSVLGKGGRRRTVLIDGDGLVVQLRAYLQHTGYRHGPLFRAEKNGRGGSLRYQSATSIGSGTVPPP